MIYLDKTFCASSNCKNECGRKLTQEEAERNSHAAFKDVVITSLSCLLSYAYFCGEPCEDGNHDWEPKAGQTRCSKCGKIEIWF